MSRNLPIRVTISLVFRYIVWQFITLIINYKEIVLDSDRIKNSLNSWSTENVVRPSEDKMPLLLILLKENTVLVLFVHRRLCLSLWYTVNQSIQTQINKF